MGDRIQIPILGGSVGHWPKTEIEKKTCAQFFDFLSCFLDFGDNKSLLRERLVMLCNIV